ncbi:MAG: DNA polymerase III subunit gamma/tau [Acidimicrobiia bacterium]|nr:DNA polymerase III subunit gamma/tau [Acidimicrobiia bacterium]
MYQVIARKYRPQTFAGLIGQEHVRTTLGNAISQGRIAHGYIFSGQRGTGKTTVARILARCLNCEKGPAAEPCTECVACREIASGGCVDVIEIDAASNRGINEMRELRENVRYRPARDRYKVFIIDEAHQITSEAFNALLKTLEEPPEWVVFVLCTTEAHKIPHTISSRCQQFSFRSVDFTEVVSRMEWICGEEGIKADAETLAVLAQAGDGSVRDSLSALDQAIACCGAELDAGEVRRLLGLFSLDTLGEVTRALEAADSRRLLEIVQELESNGHNLQHFCRELARFFRNLLVTKIAGSGSRLVAASAGELVRLADTAGKFSEPDLTRYLQLTLELYRELQYSLQPRLHMELGLLRLLHAGRIRSIEDLLAGLPSGQPPPPAPPSSRGTPPKPAPVVESKPASAGQPGSLKQRLQASLAETGLTFVADAVEHAEVTESPSQITFTAPKEFLMALRSADLRTAVTKTAGRAVKIVVQAGEAAAAAAAPKPAAAAMAEDEELSRRALSHPEVLHFQEMFPGSQVRTVRNLKQ